MIGIVTVYKVNNYGTKLQAYAMQKLMSLYDDAELLGFVSGSDRRFCAVTGKIYLRIFRKKSKDAARPDKEKVELRNQAISSFDQYYQFGKRIEGNKALKKEIHKYDAVVCGSDQLWAPSNVIADYFTLTIIPEDITKISYAASFGINRVPSILIRRYTQYLKRMQYISVREESGASIVKELINRDTPVVLDPTLMLERETWNKLRSRSVCKVQSPYIFCYFLGNQEGHREFARKLSKETGTKIVTIPHFKGWNQSDEDFGDIQLYDIDPIDFLNCIKNANYVCTDSFHGTVFSIIYEKTFAVFERFDKKDKESTNSRIYSLLNELGLEKQLMTEKSSVQAFVKENIEFDRVMGRLQELKEKSFSFLNMALGKQRNGDVV